MTTPNTLAKAVFDLIEAHQNRREPLVLAHVEAVVEQAMKPPRQQTLASILYSDDSVGDRFVGWQVESNGQGTVLDLTVLDLIDLRPRD